MLDDFPFVETEDIDPRNHQLLMGRGMPGNYLSGCREVV
jgi:hypothetical protein